MLSFNKMITRIDEITARSTSHPTFKKNKQESNIRIMIITKKSKKTTHTEKEKHKTYNRLCLKTVRHYIYETPNIFDQDLQLRSESPIGKFAKLHTVAASKNSVHSPRSLRH